MAVFLLFFFFYSLYRGSLLYISIDTHKSSAAIWRSLLQSAAEVPRELLVGMYDYQFIIQRKNSKRTHHEEYDEEKKGNKEWGIAHSAAGPPEYKKKTFHKNK